MTNITAMPPADGRELRADEKSAFERGYKACALDVYMMATGKTGVFDLDDDKFKFLQALLDQIEVYRNKQQMMMNKAHQFGV